MSIQGIEGMSAQQIVAEVRRGGRFVVFQWCLSLLVVTLRQSSEVIFIPAGESTGRHGMRFTLLTLFFGWWGIPWGPIYSVGALVQNLNGGKDVTDRILEQLGAVSGPALPSAAPQQVATQWQPVSSTSAALAPPAIAAAPVGRRISISAQPRGGAQRFVGGVLTTFGALFVLLIPLMALFPAEGASASDAWSPLVFIVPLLGPGIPLWRAGRKKLRRAREYESLVVFLRTERRVELKAVADRLKVDMGAAKAAIELAVQRGDVDLVRPPGADHYVHREDLAAAATVGGERCHSCHAPVTARVLLPGEIASCPFCGATLGGNVAAAG